MKDSLMSKIVGILFLCTILVLWWCRETTGGELVYRFKSPSFNGVGTSSHYLTIENQEFTRKAEIKSKRISEEKTREAAKKNTNFRKFLDNMESRIYAEFSKQLTDAMFGEACGTSYTAEGATVAPTAEVMENSASTTTETQTLHADAGGGTSCSGTMTFNGTTMTYTKDLANDEVVLQIDGPDGNETITLPLNDFQF
jgi:hypothetical protein